jgi:hypothetical protein
MLHALAWVYDLQAVDLLSFIINGCVAGELDGVNI